MTERENLIACSLAGFHYSKTLTALYDIFGSFTALLHSDEKTIEQLLTPYHQQFQAVLSLIRKRRELEDKVAETLAKFQIQTLLDPDYPEVLKQIYDPPWVLYVKGQPLREGPLIGMVGARKATAYGKWAAGHFASELARAGIGVVSGLAYGVDATSHQHCLEAGGYSIGVLGCGIDKIYPASHRSLFHQMEEMGSLVSEYGPGVEAQKFLFPARNRVISGLSLGTFVIEAGVRSGALITADFAMEQGREVFALPGNINGVMSHGTNRLLRDGARMVLEVNDLIDPLRPLLSDSLKPLSRKDEMLCLSDDEQKILKAIRDGQSHMDELILTTGFPVSMLNGIITVLELKGVVMQLPGKRFTVC